MLNENTKIVIMGNVQLLDYCKENEINIQKLSKCNIERMGSKYFFVLGKDISDPSLENDIDSQPDVVLMMDVSNETFKFSLTENTKRVAL